MATDTTTFTMGVAHAGVFSRDELSAGSTSLLGVLLTGESVSDKREFVQSQTMDPNLQGQVTDNNLVKRNGPGGWDFEERFPAAGLGSEVLFQAKMRSTFNTVTETGVDIAAATAPNSFTSAGIDLSQYNPGDRILVTGFPNPANQGHFFVLASDTDSVTVDRDLSIEAAGPSVTIRSESIRNGLTTRPIVHEKGFDTDGTLDRWHSPSSVVTSWNTNFELNQQGKGNISLVGAPIYHTTDPIQNGALGDSGAFSPFVSTGLGDFRLDGVSSPTRHISSVKLDVNLNARLQEELGNIAPFGTGEGDFLITGSLTNYFEAGGVGLYALYDQDTEFHLSFSATDKAGNILVFDLPRAKLTDYPVTAGGKNTDIMPTATFMAMAHQVYGYTLRVSRFAV